MNAEIISIGDELASGQCLDTNSQWLSQRLGELGIRVLYHTTVADDLAANARVFRAAVERADLVIATGGLGPTADDLTREALAKVAGVELYTDDASLAHIRSLFARRSRPMPERNVVQATFPTGSLPVFNPHGTAPGIDFTIPRRESSGAARVVALPGVPAEMREMWEASVAPSLQSAGGPRVIRHRRIKCFGVGESDLEAMVGDLIRRGREPQVGITVSGATITLRITAAGATPDDCHRAIEPTVQTIRAQLGQLVFGEEDDELEHALGRLLRQRGLSLAVVEWGAGGLVTERLSRAPEAAGFFRGGLVVSDRASLVRALGSDGAATGGSAQAIDAPPDQATIERIAGRVRELFDADLGLAVGPFPTFDPAAATPSPLFMAVALKRAAPRGRAYPFAGHPDILATRAAKQALNLARLALLGEEAP